jgi:uncharacterized protein (UPF0332 family)
VKANDLMAKAVRAALSALDMGDADGACNRAYYAMFDAARAALLVSGAEVGKTGTFSSDRRAARWTCPAWIP